MTDHEQLVDTIATSVERAMRRVIADPELTRKFWEQGYQELASHASNGASQWIGRRILTAIVVAVVTAGIVWLVKTGQLK